MRNKFRTHPKQLEDEAKVIKKDIKIQKHLNEVQKDLLDPEDIISKLIELEQVKKNENSSLEFLHIIIRSINKNFENFKLFLSSLGFAFIVICFLRHDLIKQQDLINHYMNYQTI